MKVGGPKTQNGFVSVLMKENEGLDQDQRVEGRPCPARNGRKEENGGKTLGKRRRWTNIEEGPGPYLVTPSARGRWLIGVRVQCVDLISPLRKRFTGQLKRTSSQRISSRKCETSAWGKRE